jgi:hypothetical protein
MTRGAAVIGNQALAVRDLLWSFSFEMNVGEQIGIGLGQQESGEGRDLRIVEAIVRHRGVFVVDARIAQPRLQPLRLSLCCRRESTRVLRRRPTRLPAAFCTAWQEAQKDSPYKLAPAAGSDAAFADKRGSVFRQAKCCSRSRTRICPAHRHRST